LSRTQSLLTDENNRGANRGCHGENLGEVSVKRNNHPQLLGRVVKDLSVGGFLHLDLSDVQGIPAALSQNYGGSSWKALVKQDALHAASK
jgi:hypothetical protein